MAALNLIHQSFGFINRKKIRNERDLSLAGICTLKLTKGEGKYDDLSQEHAGELSQTCIFSYVLGHVTV